MWWGWGGGATRVNVNDRSWRGPTVRQATIHFNGLEEEHWQSSHLVHLIRVFFFFVQLYLNVMAQPVLFRLFGFVKRFNSVDVKMTCVSESSTLEPTSSLQVMQ